MLSSVGLEHYLDKVGVTGSNPVAPTKQNGNLTTRKSGFSFSDMPANLFAKAFPENKNNSLIEFCGNLSTLTGPIGKNMRSEV